MRATTRKLLSVQTMMWESLPSLSRRPERLGYLRELAWLELELRTELRTHHILLILGSEVITNRLSHDNTFTTFVCLQICINKTIGVAFQRQFFQIQKIYFTTFIRLFICFKITRDVTFKRYWK